MDSKRLLHSVRLKNLLSFGEEGVEIELQPLNVLIGPNGSGKSNLVEAISILAAAPNDITLPFRREGVSEWLWRGTKEIPTAHIFVRFGEDFSPKGGGEFVEYNLKFTSLGLRFHLAQETLLKTFLSREPSKTSEVLYQAQDGEVQILNRIRLSDSNQLESGNKSVLSMPFLQVMPNTQISPRGVEISTLHYQLSKAKIYRNMDVGHSSVLRRSQSADIVADFLAEDGSNLSSVMNDLQRDYETKQTLLRYFQEFYESARDIAVDIVGNSTRIIIHEEGLSKPTPISRLSDGTIRYLCLLTILCHPNPPPLICIEEPELGLHPDIIPTVAKLLTEASQRTQLIVTTHSDILVSALSDCPEAIIVCERNKQGTSLKRLNPKEMKSWMDEEYSLGNLWRRGQIGGNRW